MPGGPTGAAPAGSFRCHVRLEQRIDFEPTGHEGLWDEEAACRILVFEPLGVSAYLRFSVAMEAGAAAGLDADGIRATLRSELARDLELRLPESLGMVVTERGTEPGWVRKVPNFEWQQDALRRIGYHSLAPHDMRRLGAEHAAGVAEHWRRTLRQGSWRPGRDSNPQPPD